MPDVKPDTQAALDAAAAEAVAATEAAKAAYEAAAGTAPKADDGGTVQKTEAELQAEQAAAAAKEEADRAAADAAVAEDAKKTGGLNKRFSELTKAAKEAQKQAAESDKRLKIALDAVEKLTGKPAAAETHVDAVVEEEEPTPPAFENPEQYQRDMAKYTADLVARTTKRAIKAQQVEDQQAKIQSDQRAATARVQSEFSARVNAFKAETPDYDEVVGKNEDVTITPVMASAISMLPKGPEVAYFLGKNLAEANRISALPALLQIAELGALQAKLAGTVVRKTNAPAPIRPISGGASHADTPLAEKSMVEYAEARLAQLRAGKSGGVTH